MRSEVFTVGKRLISRDFRIAREAMRAILRPFLFSPMRSTGKRTYARDGRLTASDGPSGMPYEGGFFRIGHRVAFLQHGLRSDLTASNLADTGLNRAIWPKMKGIEMYPRVNYEMTEDDLKELMEACRPVPCMMIGGHIPSSPQANANRAWSSLGKKMGFDADTVQPIEGKGVKFFSAVPTETEQQREEREAKEEEEKRVQDIARLESEISERQSALDKLKEKA